MSTRPSVPHTVSRGVTRTGLLVHGGAGLLMGFAAPVGGAVAIATVVTIVFSLFSPRGSVFGDLASLYDDFFDDDIAVAMFCIAVLLLATAAVVAATVIGTRRLLPFGWRRALAITMLSGLASWLLPFVVAGLLGIGFWQIVVDVIGYRTTPMLIGMVIASIVSAVLMAGANAVLGAVAMRLFAHWLRPRTWPVPSVPAPVQSPMTQVVLLCPLHHQTSASHSSHQQRLARWMPPQAPEGTAPAAP